MTNSDLIKWIRASVAEHFRTVVTPLGVSIEGQKKLTDQSDWCEIRVNGPTFTDFGVGTIVKVVINALVMTVRDESNLYAEDINVGKVVSGFSNINTFKYGNTLSDDKSFIDCLNLNSPIVVTRFGQIDPDLNVYQTTIEAEFKMIKGD